MKKYKWKRVCFGVYQLTNKEGNEIGLVRHMDYCEFWYPYLFGNDEPNGTRFCTAREAKKYVEKELEKYDNRNKTPRT